MIANRRPQIMILKTNCIYIFWYLWYDFLDVLQDTGLVHLLILPHLFTMVQGLAKGRKGKIREDKTTQVYKIRNEGASKQSHHTKGLTFSQNVRQNLRRYSDCCSRDSWIVSFSCRTDNLVIRFRFLILGMNFMGVHKVYYWCQGIVKTDTFHQEGQMRFQSFQAR